MRLFLRAHHAIPVTAGSASLMIAAWWLAGTTLPVPQLMQGRAAPVAIEMLITVLYAPLVAYGFGGTALRIERTARRPLLVPDLSLIALTCTPVALLALLAGGSGDDTFAANVTRNALAFIGIALLFLAALGESAAVAVPIGYFFVVSVLGVRPDGSAEWWAVPRAPASIVSLAGAFVLLILGAVAFHLRARPAADLRSARV